ncbi:MAG: TRIC cation channel family protein [Caldivirga sp.]|jgi:hypothetical protein
MNIVLTVTNYIGIVAFAVSGSMKAIRKGMDLLGVIVLGFVTVWSSLAPSRGGIVPRSGVLCVRFTTPALLGFLVTPKEGVTIETPQSETPPSKAGRGSWRWVVA